MVGIGRESATKSLEEFQQDGIIQIQQRMIMILDFKNLYSLAGEAATGDRQWHSYYTYHTHTNDCKHT